MPRELEFGWAVPHCLTGFAFPFFLVNDPAFRKSPLAISLRKLVCAFRLLIAESFVYPWGKGRIVVDRNDKTSRRLFYLGTYENEVGTVLASYLRPGMTFLDVGANVGIFSILAAQLVGPTGRVFSFEPELNNFRRFVRNLSINHFTNITVNRLALMDRVGSISLKVLAEDGWGMYSSVGEPLRGVKDPKGLSGHIVRQRVECSTLDDFVRQNRLGRIDMVKVDVEGAELSILKSGKRLLGGESAPVLIVEFNRITTRACGYDLVTLKKYLEALGYTLYRVIEEGRTLARVTDVLGISRYENLVALKTVHSLGAFHPDLSGFRV
jgi:FkbM family methyltransferase